MQRAIPQLCGVELLCTRFDQHLFGLRVGGQLSGVHHHGTSYSGDAALKQTRKFNKVRKKCKMF